ncbi:hypothetical protein ACIOWF_20075 [Cellulosimicrobium cellulans]|uniref:hypothetical protein n=1 Tax=Cellulosimicrobium cellulans TaxID=1710 RepID=UPI0038207A0F
MVLVFGGALSAQADQQLDSESRGSQNTSDTEPPKLALPPIELDFRLYISEIQEAVSAHPQFSDIRILEDRSGAEIYWHGKPTEELATLVAQKPAGYTVRIVPTALDPQVLREEAVQILRHEGVSSVSVPSLADRILVTVEEEGLATDRSTSALTTSSDLPIEVEVGSIEPAADRHYDTVGAGGALIDFNPGLICTAGFSMQVNGSAWMLTAAHCANVGASVGPWGNSQSWGSVHSKTTTHDAMRIGQRSGGFGAGIWEGSWMSADFVAPIVGTFTPTTGDELCISGGISGTSCGHVIQGTETWDLASAGMYGITGYVAQSVWDEWAIGNGDSGSPGYLMLYQGGDFRRYAATLTSAIRNGSSRCDAPQSYYPGTPFTRKCSNITLLTSATKAATALGGTIMTNSP